jgi:flagellar protein FliS
LEKIVAQSNALSAYRQTRIKTANQGQLILMLYDGGISNLDRAVELIRGRNGSKNDPSKIEEIGKTIIKSQEIITELMVSLDFEQGGEIAQNLFALYTWFNKELLEAHLTFDEARLLAVRNSLNDMRLSWAQVFSKNAAAEKPETGAGINIAG